MNKYERGTIFFALSFLVSSTSSGIWSAIMAIILIGYGIWTYFR